MGASHARNVGVQNARGQIVFFAESDCVYDEMYLQRAVERLDSEPEAGAVCLTGAPLITRKTLATECIDIENKVQHRLLNEGKIKPFYAWVYRKEVLTKLGGFDEKLFQGEDKDLFMRLEGAHYAVAWVSGVNWWHRRDQTTIELAKKWFTRGKTRVLYSIKHRRVVEMLKTLVPLWATIFGFIVLAWSPVVGILVLVVVALVFIGDTLRIMKISWSVVERKRGFLGYPLFVMTRNFSMAMGYTIALFTILVRKIEGKETAWNSI
jgi:cellulose synthase/poly-beta-1,6-N-acetylglucosamine synthase-like glycosyltransferase